MWQGKKIPGAAQLREYGSPVQKLISLPLPGWDPFLQQSPEPNFPLPITLQLCPCLNLLNCPKEDSLWEYLPVFLPSQSRQQRTLELSLCCCERPCRDKGRNRTIFAFLLMQQCCLWDSAASCCAWTHTSHATGRHGPEHLPPWSHTRDAHKAEHPEWKLALTQPAAK